jgi:hypothetical protein
VFSLIGYFLACYYFLQVGRGGPAVGVGGGAVGLWGEGWGCGVLRVALRLKLQPKSIEKFNRGSKLQRYSHIGDAKGE